MLNQFLKAMAVLPIYNCYHPLMRKKTNPVTNINDEVRKLADDMYDTLYNISNGVGLAANQVGGNLSLVVIDISIAEDDDDVHGRPKTPITMINPEIIEFSEEEIVMQEGCLSIPEFYEDVERPESIKIRYYDLSGKEIVRDADEFLARVMQHETDHLNGILFTDKISPFRRTLNKNKLRRIEKGLIIPKYPMINADGTIQEKY